VRAPLRFAAVDELFPRALSSGMRALPLLVLCLACGPSVVSRPVTESSVETADPVAPANVDGLEAEVGEGAAEPCQCEAPGRRGSWRVIQPG